ATGGGGDPLPERDILEGFDRLIAADRLFGAELNSSIIKKSGKGAPFLVRRHPSRHRMLELWRDLFANRVSPKDLLDALAPEVLGLAHGDGLLLFGKGRVLYDCQIARGNEAVGHLTLSFYREREPVFHFLPLPRRPGRRIVYIEGISLSAQSTGYASSLFRHYERLFHDIGFHRFRLKASLSVGKYYWAKEGFDCEDRVQFREMRERLQELVRRFDLPVEEQEIRRLTHAGDVAAFRRDLKIPVYRNPEGYYATARDESHGEEILFPLGKAFLLCYEPWDGYKVIYTDTPRRTGFVWSEAFLDHGVRPGHPESPKRLEALSEAIREEGMRESLIFLEPYLPSMGSLHAVHDPAYLEAFREAVARGDRHFAVRDCAISGGSYEAALLAAGGVMAGIDAVLSGRSDNVFCAVRPPGHHAGRNSAMGFCFVNNVAAGARYARSAHGVRRIYILDWDVHHGNGTQALFEEDPLTFFCSLHEHPSFCFPGTGRRLEKGKGLGLGATLNVPLAPHAGDRELLEAFEREVVPSIDAFRPELILLSAGFDAHRDDPIAELEWTEDAFVHMTRRVLELADRHCEGRVVSVLEGGYRMESLVASAIAHIRTLQGREVPPCSSARG
ncbi:histone deacetylase family protein, partial [Candidatus Deferrimicrobium sp.]|uniref:histone deacetylase family protein n=1 Tax=Candidatus Deferrimicrobium sp. TaxID=3060586 RepID=UPI003C5AD7A5